MLSQNQIELCSGITAQYDYYVCYYRGEYFDYGMTQRDYLIEIVCSDTLPILQGSTFNFSDCVYYRITDNKYITMQNHGSFSLSPISDMDIVYSNAIEGKPQLCYEISSFRNFDFGYYFALVVLVLLSGSIILRLIFGGKN